ncbi:MAG: O-antigen ligase family protein [Oscillospiraceae bacterium]
MRINPATDQMKRFRLPSLGDMFLWMAALIGLMGFLFFIFKDGPSVKKATTVLILCAAVIAAVVFLRNALLGIYALVAFLPLLAASFLSTRIINIPGIKLEILIPFGALFCLLINKVPSDLGAREKKIIMALTVIYLFSMFRAIGFALPFLSTEEPVTAGQFFRSYILKDYVYFFPFIFICAYLREDKDIHSLLQSLNIGVLLLGGYLLILYITTLRFYGDFETIRDYYLLFYPAHTNEIANFFLLAVPLLMGYAFYKKKLVYFGVLGIALVSILMLYSRTVYMLTAVAVVVFLVMEKKGLLLLGGVGIVGASFPFWPDNVVTRVTSLFQSSNANQLTAGRTDEIWQPLIQEMLGYDPLTLLFGFGRYGIFQTKAFNQGSMLAVSHAHNAYLNTILDAGIVGMIFFVAVILYYLYQFYKASKKTENSFRKLMLRCICISIVLYMARGMSGGFFLPCLTNMYLWAILAFGVVCLKAEQKSQVQQMRAPIQ